MRRHVLVVGDDATVAERIRQALSDHGFTVWAAASEDEAYRRIASIPTLDAMVLQADLARRRELEEFARQVIPHVGVVYVGARESVSADPAGRRSSRLWLEPPFSADQIVESVLLACAG